MPPNSQPGVYFISTGCAKGHTKETDQYRTGEGILKGDTNDAIARHKGSRDCEMDWTKTRTIDVEPIRFNRKAREALEIRRLGTGPDEKRGVNIDLGDYVTTEICSILFPKINQMKGIASNTIGCLLQSVTVYDMTQRKWSYL